MNQNNDFDNRYNNQNPQYRSYNNMNQQYNYNQGNNQNRYSPPPIQNTNMYNTYINREQITSAPSKEKIKYGKVLIPIIVIFIIAIVGFASVKLYKSMTAKTRTFMIYMVGSDLETESKQGTYSISEIDGEKIDLKNNNVLLMVGGAKKWHNFVDPNEIAIYRLTTKGFEKMKTFEVKSMGKSDNLTTFLDYSYNNYPAKKFDLIFWNHGLGAMGIEQDEISSDYLSISELNTAMKNSKFNNEKLELTIFYNCLASNLHIAKVMSNYSEYMVASEEIFYLSKALNRLNFLEQVTTNATAYDIGKLFIDQSDKVITNYNNTHSKKLDSTLSIIDLKNIPKLDKKINTFISSIDVNKNYYKISNLRKNLFTYGTSQTKDYDVVDLYELVSALDNLNDHSNGISVYFPYFGSDTAIEIHLNAFNKLWNDNYNTFINDYYDIRSGAKQLVRSERENNINLLENGVIKENDKLTLYLTDSEKEKYQNAYFYIFEKEDEDYTLLLKSNNIELENNKLILKDNRLLKVDDKIISLVIDDDTMYNYGTLSNNVDVLEVVNFIDSKDNINIVETVLDSGIYPNSGLIEYDDYNKISFYILKYKIDDILGEDWKEMVEKENIEFDKNNYNMVLDNNNESNYYVMVELFDEHHDSYYSRISEIK